MTIMEQAQSRSAAAIAAVAARRTPEQDQLRQAANTVIQSRIRRLWMAGEGDCLRLPATEAIDIDAEREFAVAAERITK